MLAIYDFDRELRLLLIDAIERVEISLLAPEKASPRATAAACCTAKVTRRFSSMAFPRVILATSVTTSKSSLRKRPSRSLHCQTKQIRQLIENGQFEEVNAVVPPVTPACWQKAVAVGLLRSPVYVRALYFFQSVFE